jgi:abhydrolase domain-containing protein 6
MKPAAALAAGLVLLSALWLWRDPMVLVRAEFARQRLAAGLSVQQIQAGGHRWVYAERKATRADAPTLVMLHGFTGSKENWYPLAHQLDGEYRLIIPDLPGWGASERKPDADYGFTAQSERLSAFLSTLVREPGSQLVLLGHSMGGGIAALTAADHPQQVDRLGLFDAAGVRFRDNRFGREVLAGQNPFAVYDEASLQRYLDTVFYDQSAKPSIPWPASAAMIGWRKRQAAFEQRVLDRIGRSDERFLPGERATSIRQPTLLLWCRQDEVIDSSAAGLYAARIPQATLVLLDGCGHMSIMERPQEVAAAVRLLVAEGETP